MESLHYNPNEVLTPIYLGDRLVLVPNIDYYAYASMRPEEALAKYVLTRILENNYIEVLEDD